MPELSSDREQGLYAANVGQTEVHYSYVRLKCSVLLDRFSSIYCLGDQLHIRRITNIGRDTFSNGRMIVNTQNAD
jgi:hypothetical protein